MNEASFFISTIHAIMIFMNFMFIIFIEFLLFCNGSNFIKLLRVHFVELSKYLKSSGLIIAN